jgi:hypothetical protein
LLKKTSDSFTVVFYGLTIFSCKTAQLCAARRESETTETPSIRNGLQRFENLRNSLGLNYQFFATDFAHRPLA